MNSLAIINYHHELANGQVDQSQHDRSEQSYLHNNDNKSSVSQSVDNSLRIIQNNFNKPQVHGQASTPSKQPPQHREKRIFGQQRDTVQQYSPMRIQSKLNNKMSMVS